MHPRLAPYPEVAFLLSRLQQEVRHVLGSHFLGLYLTGSLALGDFDPERSDIDFVVASAGTLPAHAVSALRAMHAQLAAGPSKWGSELEGSYAPRAVLRHYDPAVPFPHIDRGGVLSVEPHATDWLIQCHTLYHHGIVLAGPSPRMLLDPLSTDEVRRAVLDLLWWWELQLADTSRVAQSGYQAYAILTMCRILYTMQHGAIVSKPAAARWAQPQLKPSWRDLIARAQSWQPGTVLDALPETLAFIRYTLHRVR